MNGCRKRMLGEIKWGNVSLETWDVLSSTAPPVETAVQLIRYESDFRVTVVMLGFVRTHTVQTTFSNDHRQHLQSVCTSEYDQQRDVCLKISPNFLTYYSSNNLLRADRRLVMGPEELRWGDKALRSLHDLWSSDYIVHSDQLEP